MLKAIRSRSRITVLYVNVHCMNLQHDDPEYARALRAADIVYCDGTGVRLGARLAGLSLPERMTGADWIDDLCRLAVSEGLSLFLLGGAPGVSDKAARVLERRFPGLLIAGTASGYEADSSIEVVLRARRTDILLVGLGSPKQEKWIEAHRQSLDVPVVWAVGALFDFVTGRIPRGPRWMTDHGLEWICRLAAEPAKLWRRYLLGNPRFLMRVVLTYWAPRGPRS